MIPWSSRSCLTEVSTLSAMDMGRLTRTRSPLGSCLTTDTCSHRSPEVAEFCAASVSADIPSNARAASPARIVTLLEIMLDMLKTLLDLLLSLLTQSTEGKFRQYEVGGGEIEAGLCSGESRLQDYGGQGGQGQPQRVR